MGSVGITTDQWLDAASYRRSVYGVKSTSNVSDERVKEIVEKVLSFAPSAFNSQPTRITLAHGEKHKQFWDVILGIAEPALKQNAGEEVWAQLGPMFEMHRNSYGSIVFWESGSVIEAYQAKHKSSAHMFPEWSEHATGIANILTWTALELEGLGASLQHMSSIPGVEDALKKFCGVPDDYRLKAHIVYGDHPGNHPEKPPKDPFSETIKVL